MLLCTYMQQLPGLLPSNHNNTNKAPIPVTFRFPEKVLCAHFGGQRVQKGVSGWI